MNLKVLKDNELLKQTKELVSKERQLLTQVLHHLREIEKRKLFSDLGYQSLFEYAVKELKYSEGQARRRIQAMRLIKELPELEAKIESGKLSLTHISQAQSYFREAKKSQSQPLEPEAKLELLEQLENKSSREAQRMILSLQPEISIPVERQRPITDEHTEVRFIMNKQLESQLEELRSLLGIRGASMKLSELVEYMAQVSIEHMKAKRFGKRRMERGKTEGPKNQHIELLKTEGPENQGVELLKTEGPENQQIELLKTEGSENQHIELLKTEGSVPIQAEQNRAGRFENRHTEQVEFERLEIHARQVMTKESKKHHSNQIAVVSSKKRRAATPAPELTAKNIKPQKSSKNDRYISSVLRYEIWMRDKGQCVNCGGRRHLNVDHVQPLALGGQTHIENLRLLCFHCNQRAGIKSFGYREYASRKTANRLC